MAKTGEKAPETTGYVCTKCGKTTHVAQGDTIPPCAHCGNTTYREE